MRTCFLLLLLVVSSISCKDEDPKIAAPEIETLMPTNISLTSAMTGGIITTDHPELVTQRGICWGRSPGPSLENISSKTRDGAGGGTFQTELKGFVLTTYYLRAYAIFQEIAYYGNEIVLDLEKLVPTILTENATGITDNSATVSTQINYVGTEPILEKGICWGTGPAPTVETSTKIKEDGTNLQFSKTLAPLAQLTAYYVRAYVITSFGTFYGNEIQILILPEPVFGSVTDIDGNDYKTVQIGPQTWMAENLKAIRFNDGTPIAGLISEADFKNATSRAYTAYGSNQSNIPTYGLLYNGYTATSDKNVCPQGWHVPGNGDWYVLASALGGLETAGGRMKAISPTWATPNEAATNASGFSGLPGGSYCRVCIGNNGVFADQGTDGYWWSAQTGVFFYLTNNLASMRTRSTGQLNDGMSIRCVKD